MRPYPRVDRARHQIRRAAIRPPKPVRLQDLGVAAEQAAANLRAWAESQRWLPKLSAPTGAQFNKDGAQ